MTTPEQPSATGNLITPEQRQRNIRRGLLIGAGMALVTLLLLRGLMWLAQFVLIMGMLAITPTTSIYVLLLLIACTQMLIGGLIGYRTTGERRSFEQNLRRGFLWFTLLLIITSPAYICPMLMVLGNGPS